MTPLPPGLPGNENPAVIAAQEELERQRKAAEEVRKTAEQKALEAAQAAAEKSRQEAIERGRQRDIEYKEAQAAGAIPKLTAEQQKSAAYAEGIKQVAGSQQIAPSRTAMPEQVITPDRSRTITASDLARSDPYLYSKFVNEGYDAYSKAVDKRNKDLTELSEKQFKDYLRKNDPYLHDVYVRGGVEAYNKAVAKRGSDFKAIEKQYQEDKAKYEAEEKEFRENLRKNDPYLHDVYVRGGVEAYNKAVAKREIDFAQIDKQWANEHTLLPDGSWMKNTDLEQFKKDSPAGYALLMSKGYKVYEAEYAIGEKLIKKYSDKKGNLNLDLAMMQLSGDDIKSLSLLLKKEDIDASMERVKPYRELYAEQGGKPKYIGQTVMKIGESKNISELAERTRAGMAEAQVGAQAAGQYIQEGREKLHETLSKLPKAVGVPAEFLARVAGGALVVAPYYMMNMSIAGVGLTVSKNKAGYIRDVAKGTAQFFAAIPGEVAKDPNMAGELIGVFFVGPGGLLKIGKAAATRLSPWYLPGQGMRYSFSTGKLPVKYGDLAGLVKAGKITEVDIANAIARAEKKALKTPDKIATANVGKTKIKITIEPTPVSKQLGGVLWHAAPEKSSFAVKEFKVAATGSEPALFTSIQSSPRFAFMSAEGSAATNPALVMIYTKNGIKWYPGSISGAKSLDIMKSKGFDYLGSGKAKPGAYGPIKTYAARFENEALLPNGMKAYRVFNLRSRILGAKAGEFVTVEKGWVMPVYRFAEQGAKVPKETIAKMTAIRIESTLHSLRLLLKSQKAKGKTGFHSEIGRAAVDNLSKQLEAIGRAASRSYRGRAADKVYRDAIDREMLRRFDDALKRYPELETLYRANPDRYEGFYRDRLNYDFSRYYAVPVSPQRYLPETIRVQRDIRQEQRITRPEVARAPEPARPERIEPERIEPVRPPEVVRPPRPNAPRPLRETRIERPPEPPRPPEQPRPGRPPERPELKRPPELPRPPEPGRPPRPPEPNRPPPPPRPKLKGGTPPPVDKRKGGDREWTPAEIRGAIKWKDGFTVFAIKSPYRRGMDETAWNIENLPPSLDMNDVVDITGAGSQEKTAKASGNFPRHRTVDVGNQDVIIRRTGSNRVKMQHVRDTRGTRSQNTIRKQRTISKKRGRIYHTHAGGGEILSRGPIFGV